MQRPIRPGALPFLNIWNQEGRQIGVTGMATTRRPMPSQSLGLKIFLCGDVMTGRGIDQILPKPCDPRLHEDFVETAADYVRLAEDVHGKIRTPVALSYIWGDALAELESARPNLRIINLETSITRSETYVPKGINYKMSPENAGCLLAAKVDCCALANNHILDWGEAGLLDTLVTLERLGIKTAGAGRNRDEAWAPAILAGAGNGRVLVFSCASASSGVPRSWAATGEGAGVALLPDSLESGVALASSEIARWRNADDVVILSVHWGSNWGYQIPQEQKRFAREMIDQTDISVLHGHSSHHAKGIEVYRDRLILYGCGDFLNDYEGIRGYEAFRDDLALMYFAQIDPPSRDLVALDMTPLQIKNFQLRRPSGSDIEWLRTTLDDECATLGARVEAMEPARLGLCWSSSGS